MLATELRCDQWNCLSRRHRSSFTAGEEVSGATVNLYTDDGDTVFEPGAGDALTATTLWRCRPIPF